VVRRAEWALCDERLARREQTDDAVNLRRFQRLLQRQRRQNGRQAFGEPLTTAASAALSFGTSRPILPSALARKAIDNALSPTARHPSPDTF